MYLFDIKKQPKATKANKTNKTNTHSHTHTHTLTHHSTSMTSMTSLSLLQCCGGHDADHLGEFIDKKATEDKATEDKAFEDKVAEDEYLLIGTRLYLIVQAVEAMSPETKTHQSS